MLNRNHLFLGRQVLLLSEMHDPVVNFVEVIMVFRHLKTSNEGVFVTQRKKRCCFFRGGLPPKEREMFVCSKKATFSSTGKIAAKSPVEVSPRSFSRWFLLLNFNGSQSKKPPNHHPKTTPAIEWPLPGTCGPWSNGSSNCRGF